MEGPIYTRRAIREYKNEPIAKEMIEKVLKAGSYGPTAMGKDVARFFVINHNESAVSKTISDDCLKQLPFGIPDIFYAAPNVIFVYVEDSYPGCEDLDGGLIVQNMLLQAAELKLGTVVVGCTKGFAPMISKVLKIESDKMHYVTAIAIGHPTEENANHIKDKSPVHVQYL